MAERKRATKKPTAFQKASEEHNRKLDNLVMLLRDHIERETTEYQPELARKLDRRYQIKEVWKWVAITVVAFLLGSGGTRVLGSQDLAEFVAVSNAQVESIEEELDELDDMNADIRERLKGIETLLETEYAIHHPKGEHLTTP